MWCTGISSLDVYNQIRYMSGGLILPSHLSNWQSSMQIEDNMSFWQRLVNFCQVWMQMYIWMNKNIPRQNTLVREYLGPDIPSISDITSNMSLYLVNKHPMISILRQELPNVIFYHGFHIAAVPPPLPKVCVLSSLSRYFHTKFNLESSSRKFLMTYL